MMKTSIKRIVSLAVLLALMLPVLVANAQWTIIDFHYAESNDPDGLCGTGDGMLTMRFDIDMIAPIPYTRLGAILEDSSGTIIGWNVQGFLAPDPISITLGIGGYLPIDPDRPKPTNRPWRLTLYGLPDPTEPNTSIPVALSGQMLTPSLVFDPALFASSCAFLPYVGLQGERRINETGELETQVFIAQDDDGNPALHIYEVNDAGQGEFSLAITQDILAPFVGNPPASNTQIATSASGKVTLYVLDTGEFQINTGPDENGNVYVTIFDAIPPTTTYGYSFNVYDILGND